MATVDLVAGDWIRSPLAAPGPPPHRDPSRPGPKIAVAVIWADAAQRVPLAIQDVCGCQALVVRVERHEGVTPPSS